MIHNNAKWLEVAFVNAAILLPSHPNRRHKGRLTLGSLRKAHHPYAGNMGWASLRKVHHPYAGNMGWALRQIQWSSTENRGVNRSMLNEVSWTSNYASITISSHVSRLSLNLEIFERDVPARKARRVEWWRNKCITYSLCNQMWLVSVEIRSRHRPDTVLPHNSPTGSVLEKLFWHKKTQEPQFFTSGPLHGSPQ